MVSMCPLTHLDLQIPTLPKTPPHHRQQRGGAPSSPSASNTFARVKTPPQPQSEQEWANFINEYRKAGRWSQCRAQSMNQPGRPSLQQDTGSTNKAPPIQPRARRSQSVVEATHPSARACADHCLDPIDFFSTHGYLSAPLPLRKELETRKAALRRYGLHKGGFRQRLDRYVQHARRVLGGTAAYIVTHSVDDDEAIICVSRQGPPREVAPPTYNRATAVCGHALLLGASEVLVVPDLLADWRFAASPTVQRSGTRFYASAPMVLDTGAPGSSSRHRVSIGCLCVTSTEPRQDFGDEEVQTLAEIAQMACETLEQEHQAELAKRAEKIQRAITEIADYSWVCAASTSSSIDFAMDATTKPYQSLASMEVKTIAASLGACATMIDVTPFRLSTARGGPISSGYRTSSPLFSPSSGTVSSPWSPRREPTDLSPRIFRMPSSGSSEAVVRANQDGTSWSSFSNPASVDEQLSTLGSSSASSISSTHPESGYFTNGKHTRTSSDLRRTLSIAGYSQADIDPTHMPTIFAQSSNCATPLQMNSTSRAAIGRFLADWRREKDQQGTATRYIKGPFFVAGSAASSSPSPSEEWDSNSTPASPKLQYNQNPLGPLFASDDPNAPKPAMYVAMAVTADSDNPQATFLLVVSFDEIAVLEQTDFNLMTACCRIMEHALLRQKVRLAEKVQMDFVRGIQHEMRTPINGISGITDLIRSVIVSGGGGGLDFSPGGFLSTALEGIRLAAGNISSILDDVLDFGDLSGIRSADHQIARLDEAFLSPLLEEVGQEEIEIAAIQLRHTAKLSAKGYEHAAGLDDEAIGEGVDVRPPDFFVHIDPALRGRFKVDRTTMRKIFRKLLHNCFRFTTRDERDFAVVEVKIRVATPAELPTSLSASSAHSHGVEGRETWVAFDFTDTGCGMEADFIQTRFLQPFAKGDSFQQGAGMGGAIASGLTHRLGGYMDINSEPGKGTRITVVLPLVSLPSTATACVPKLVLPVTKATFLGFEHDATKEKTADMIKTHLMDFAVSTTAIAEEADLIVATSVYLRQIAAPDGLASKGAIFIVVSSDPLERLDQMPCLATVQAHLFQPPFGPAALSGLMDFLKESVPFSLSPGSSLSLRNGTEEPSPRVDVPPHGSCEEDATEANEPVTGVAVAEAQVPDVQIALSAREQPSTSASVRNAVVSPTESAQIPRDFRVLAVEDNPTNMKILTVVLQRQGIEYYQAQDGAEAVEQFIQHRPHLILLDISLPVFDGFEVCRRLREIEEVEAAQAILRGDAVPIPTKIIAVTALSSKDDQRNGLALGMDEWHTKPLAPRVLAKCLKEWQGEIQAALDEAAAIQALSENSDSPRA
ncbi:unnamed protein product [Parajaminaea phylloscopi]